MQIDQNQLMDFRVFMFLVLISVSSRFIHFGELIDSPHTWRQADTAHYIYDYYINGINLLRPKVCWLGDYGTLLLEFPIIEATVAQAYLLFGESHIVARGIFYLIFLGSAFYFYRLTELLFNKEVAQYAVLFFLSAPLSLAYSRAIHVDFGVIFFCIGMTYHFNKAYAEEDRHHLLFGSILATFAFLIKVPYILIFIGTIVYSIHTFRKWRYFFKTLIIPIVPVIIFLIWNHWVYLVNSSAPEWQFILGYRKFIFSESLHWYFGPIEQRLDLINWYQVGYRVLTEIHVFVGLPIAIYGMYKSTSVELKHIIIWITGSLLYLVIFFNLNLIHNYYQIPFVVPISLIMGLGMSYIGKELNRCHYMTVLIISTYLICSFIYAENNYYKVNWLQQEISSRIKEETRADDLVIVNHGNLDSKYPEYLYGARRRGWQLISYGIESTMIDKLIYEGADYFCSVRIEDWQGEFGDYLNNFQSEIFDLKHSKEKLYIYSLGCN